MSAMVITSEPASKMERFFYRIHPVGSEANENLWRLYTIGMSNGGMVKGILLMREADLYRKLIVEIS